MADSKSAALPREGIGCVIMASGLSVRYGRNKLMERLNGREVILHTAAAARSAGLDPVIVTRSPEVRELARAHDFRTVLHDLPRKSDAMRIGIRAAEEGPAAPAGYLFMQGDQPLVTPGSLRNLAACFAEHPETAVRLGYGREAGSPVLFPASCRDALLACEGEQGGSEVLRSGRIACRIVQAAGAWELWDADTPEDMERIRRHEAGKKELIIVRGAGDISTGTIHRLYRAGFPVLALEVPFPSAIRRKVALSEAVYDGTAGVEGVTAVRISPEEDWHDLEEQVLAALAKGLVPLLTDPEGRSISLLRPGVVVDAILAKKNLGTTMDMAPLTIALGPGFEAGKDVHYVVETMRGHNLGRIIREGCAQKNTGIPGVIAGFGAERVIRAPAAGIFRLRLDIGSMAEPGEEIGRVTAPDGTQTAVTTVIGGLLRGVIRDGFPVTKGFKVADVDPRREEYGNCFTISDKARCIAGSVLELVCAHRAEAGA